MTPAQQQEKIRNQTSIALKVFLSVPKQEVWSSSDIMADLKRQGVSISLSKLEGCLNSLREDKLIKEVGIGRWTQVKTSKTQHEPVIIRRQEIDVMTPKTTAPKKTPTKSPLEILEAIAEQAKNLQQAVENAALEITEYIEAAEAKGHKLTQLQELLKSL